MPALENCTPDFRRGVVAVCRWGGAVFIGGAEAGGAKGGVASWCVMACSHCSGWFGSAGWSFSAGARRRRVVPQRVTFVSVSCVRAWPHSMGGNADVLVLGVFAGPPEDLVYDGLVGTFLRGG